MTLPIEKYFNQPPLEKDKIKERLLSEVRSIESIKTADEPQKKLVKEFARDFMKAMGEAGGRPYEDINEFYKNFRGNFLVRREDPMKLAAALLGHESIPLAFDRDLAADGRMYPNCARWSGYGDNRGLQNAFMEGHASVGQGQLIAVVGFKEGKDLKIRGVDDEENIPGGLDREFVRVAEGAIDPEDVAFIAMRVSKDSFPDDFEDQADQKSESPYLFRGFDFSQSAEESSSQFQKAA
ncbi:hypothetical protein M1432_02450 [Patescibacteria group bacterium]|nr:hypothetical protein [Patescibacteria group bacterium]